MAKMTVLEMTQDILSDMNSDEINSINDTTEAYQVANIIQDTYFAITDGKENPWMRQLFRLTSVGLLAKPTYLQIPENVVDIEWIKYNVRSATDTKDRYATIKYKTPTEFLEFTEQRNNSASNVTTITDYSDTPILIVNDKAPQFWTSFDDNYIIFDSYDSAVDTTITASKTQSYGKYYPTFTLSDNFTADLPVQMFSYFLNEAKSTCFLVLKQEANKKAEQHSVTQRRRMSQAQWKLKRGITYPSYGRK
jgi:hypothetical protein